MSGRSRGRAVPRQDFVAAKATDRGRIAPGLHRCSRPLQRLLPACRDRSVWLHRVLHGAVLRSRQFLRRRSGPARGTRPKRPRNRDLRVLLRWCRRRCCHAGVSSGTSLLRGSRDAPAVAGDLHRYQNSAFAGRVGDVAANVQTRYAFRKILRRPRSFFFHLGVTNRWCRPSLRRHRYRHRVGRRPKYADGRHDPCCVSTPRWRWRA